MEQDIMEITGEKIENKRVLFICRETYSQPLWFIAERLKEKNDVACFFIMSTECSYNKCYYNVNTYYRFKEELPGIRLYDVKDICEEYTNRLEAAGYKRKGQLQLFDRIYQPDQKVRSRRNERKPIADMEYLEMIEKEYSHFKNLNMQLMCSQENTRHYHFRYYWSVTNYDENMLWLELNYKKILGIFEEFKPDMILDFDNAELQRTIVNEVAYKKNVPYITVEYSKFGYYKYPTFQNTIGIDDYVVKQYNENLKLTPGELKDEYDYIHEYRNKSTIMNKEFAGTVTSQYERDSIIWILRVMRGKFHYFFDMDIAKGNHKLKKKNRILYAPSLPYIKHYWQVMTLRRKFMGKNRLFEAPREGEDYVYMPLHLIPESTVFVKASYYVDELSLIEAVSKSLPVGWWLYVKEHQAMLGERSVDFYKKVRQLHNVRLVQVNHYHDPKPWIMNAKGVITIVGTTAYEEALLGRRSILFGDVPFELIDGITKVHSYEELPELIRNFGEIDNIHSCAAYLKTIKDVGFEIDLFYLMAKAEKILAHEEERDEKFVSQIDELMKFYEAGYARWNSYNKKQ
ncbi:MAG: hypothetical protein K6E88_01180 [Lachnospiraceae bacterium]|nr:hypothetical protein [Lachnospiraceae bacterium]